MRFQDRNLSIFRPVNLKPGMQLLLPEPPEGWEENFVDESEEEED